MQPDSFKYDAFISYRHMELDTAAARKVHRLLEGYRIPGDIAKKVGKKKFQRVFRDQEELPVSEDLSTDILHALENSQYLILICSKNLPLSRWCLKEIELFKKFRGNRYILPLLIDGEPDDSFPSLIRFRGEEEIEPLAADIRAHSLSGMFRKLRRHEILRLIAPMLGVSYDNLRQRHKARFLKKVVLFSTSIAICLGIFGSVVLNQYLYNIRLSGDNHQLNLSLLQAKKNIQATELELDKKKKAVAAVEEELSRKKLQLDSASASIQKKQEELLAANEELFAANKELLAKQEQLAALLIENARKKEELAQTVAEIKEQKLFTSLTYAQVAIGRGDKAKGTAIVLEALNQFDVRSSRYPEFCDEADVLLAKGTYRPQYEAFSILKNEDQTNTCLFSSDDRFIITLSNDQTAVQWDARSGEKMRTFKHIGEVAAACLSADNRRLFTATRDYKITIWDVASGEKVKETGMFKPYFQDTASSVYKLVYHPSSETLDAFAYYSQNYRTQIISVRWDVAHNTIKRILDGASAIAVSRDGNYLVSAGKNGKITVSHAFDSKTLSCTLPQDYQVNEVSVSGNNRYFITCGLMGEDPILVWDLKTGKRLNTIQGPYAVIGLTVAPDHRSFAAATYDGGCYIYSLESGKELCHFQTDGMPMAGVLYLKDSKHLITSASFSGKLLDVWKLETLTDEEGNQSEQAVHLMQMVPPDLDITDRVLSNRGDCLAITCTNGTTTLYNLQMAFNQKIQSHVSNVLALSGDRYLARNPDELNSLAVMDSRTGKALKKFTYPEKIIDIVSVSANFKYALISARIEQRLYLLELETGKRSPLSIPFSFAAASIDDTGTRAVILQSNLKLAAINLRTGVKNGEISLEVDVGAISQWDIAADFKANRLVAVGTYPRSIENAAYVFQLNTGKLLYEINDPELDSAFEAGYGGKTVAAPFLSSAKIWTFQGFETLVQEARYLQNGRVLTDEERKACGLE